MSDGMPDEFLGRLFTVDIEQMHYQLLFGAPKYTRAELLKIKREIYNKEQGVIEGTCVEVLPESRRIESGTSQE